MNDFHGFYTKLNLYELATHICDGFNNNTKSLQHKYSKYLIRMNDYHGFEAKSNLYDYSSNIWDRFSNKTKL